MTLGIQRVTEKFCESLQFDLSATTERVDCGGEHTERVGLLGGVEIPRGLNL